MFPCIFVYVQLYVAVQQVQYLTITPRGLLLLVVEELGKYINII